MSTPREMDRELTRMLFLLKMVEAGKLTIGSAIKQVEAEATEDLIAYVEKKVSEA